jgi:hypothetical protein
MPEITFSAVVFFDPTVTGNMTQNVAYQMGSLFQRQYKITAVVALSSVNALDRTE